MRTDPDAVDRSIDLDAALRRVLAETAQVTGEAFFGALVERLAGALGTVGAILAEALLGRQQLRIHALWLRGRWIPGFDYDTAGTPCAAGSGGCYTCPTGWASASPEPPASSTPTP